MANSIKCGQCEHFWAIQKGVRGGTTIPQSRGHCVINSVYPKNKPGNPVFPPKAKLEDLPGNVARVKIVHKDTLELSCKNAVRKEASK
jgi:hypothetical protein